MKTRRLVSLGLLSALPLMLGAGEVSVGDTAGEVRAALGAPRGQARLGGRQVLYFDRGEIELQGGAVIRVALLSEQELARQEARRAAEAERVQARNAEGEAVKARQLADANFQSAPPAYQVEYWSNFARRYPGVSCAEQLGLARARFVAEAEERHARRAEAESEARAEAPQVATYPYGYPVGYGGWNLRYRSAGLGPIVYRFDEKPVPLIAGPVVPPVFNFGPPPAARNAEVRRPREHGRNERPPPAWHAPDTQAPQGGFDDDRRATPRWHY